MRELSATIRAATAADARELARLRWEFRVESGTPVTRSREAFDEEMRAFVSEVLSGVAAWRVWVAEDDGRLVGCVWLQLVEKVPHPNRGRWERPVAYVTNMFVEPARRGAGLGRELLETAVGFARERGVDGVALWPSERSVPFYERAGFGRPGGPLWLQVAGD
jgi:GNAT superfamily N-acetyltransferase